MKTIYTRNVEETIELGKLIGHMMFSGAIITLNGDLGAGKTTLTKGIALGLGVKRVVNSPTFTIMKVYDGRIPLYHMDVYRLDGIGFDYDLEDYLYGEGVSVVEWSDNIKDSLEGFLRIDISIENGNRKFTLSTDDSRYNMILEKL
ncbi:tRNA (adenosine(37)-N6)-threonylcarbamoyltransferase complex ATPase subunit type 1 TsaE [Mycoplasmatota bacterium]|nr:tRNA (adenosine(37)-N6)-threonylcarbamoyltransferase complex ATPase subunit type 1 TsaE [Mycoplasmatota bacterium]